MARTPSRRKTPKKDRHVTEDEFVAVMSRLDESTQAFLLGVSQMLHAHGRDRVITICESVVDNFRKMPRGRRRQVAPTDSAVQFPPEFPLPPETMDALGSLTFLRALLHKPNDLIDERARVVFLGLVTVALKDLEPAPLPTWFFAWQVFSEDQQERVAQVVTEIVRENERTKRPH